MPRHFILLLPILACVLCAQPSPQATANRFFERAAGLTGSLRSVHLNPKLGEAVDELARRLAAEGFETKPMVAGSDIQVGARRIPVPQIQWWKRLDNPAGRAWVDIIELPDEAAGRRIAEQWQQPHTGTTYPDAFAFIALRAENGLDSVSSIVIRGRHVINLGVSIPFHVRLWEAPGNSPDELAAIDRAVDRLASTLEATVRTLKDPAYVTWVPSANPTADQIRMRRVASFARLWSEVKYNFVFLNERRNLDWESMLELYLPRIMSAGSNDEYIATLKEAVALLADGHTGVQGGAAVDQPAVWIEPIEGRPVLTALADLPELGSTNLRPGMELLSVDGVPVDELRKKRELTAAASTAQSRAITVDWMLLQGPPNSTAKAVFRAADGNRVEAELNRNQSSVPAKALPWRKPSFEYRELPGNIAYVALNSFGSDSVVKRFDEHFDRILKSSGLIIDVRSNGGGSSGNGYSIVSRLIEQGTSLKTTAWRTRNYKPSFRAWGRPEEWHEGAHAEIQARGETPYRKPVVVLIGPNTFSAAEDFLAPLKMSRRATLVGSPTGGSTGQPLSVPLYQASARICTKWDRFADGTEFVGVGVQPDVRIDLTRGDVVAGRDPVLEKAQEILTR